MEKEKSGFFAKLKSGLNKTRINLLDGLDSVFHGFSEIDDDFYEELEEVLVMADIGVKTSGEIIEEIKTLVKVEHIKSPEQTAALLCIAVLIAAMVLLFLRNSPMKMAQNIDLNIVRRALQEQNLNMLLRYVMRFLRFGNLPQIARL